MAQQLLVWMRPDVAAIAGEGSAGSLRGDMTNAAANARAAADAQGSSKLIKGLKVCTGKSTPPCKPTWSCGFALPGCTVLLCLGAPCCVAW
eukprot:365949-Chlamydomonas_euryale.AAC.22